MLHESADIQLPLSVLPKCQCVLIRQLCSTGLCPPTPPIPCSSTLYQSLETSRNNAVLRFLPTAHADLDMYSNLCRIACYLCLFWKLVLQGITDSDLSWHGWHTRKAQHRQSWQVELSQLGNIIATRVSATQNAGNAMPITGQASTKHASSMMTFSSKTPH